MILRLAVLAWAALSGAAWACPSPDDTLLFHSCWGEARIDVALLPEDIVKLAHPTPRSLMVTGAYTSAEKRADGGPKPVGLFVHQGQVVNPNLARMDGVLVVDRTGAPEIYVRTAVPGTGGVSDLTDPVVRAAFAKDAAARGLSVLQSHLLVVDGRLDVRPVENAPVATRRFLILDAHGFAIVQTSGADTLFDAGSWVVETYAPRMALNLDMGSYDYCIQGTEGVPRNCGVLAQDGTTRLSNVLRLVFAPAE